MIYSAHSHLLSSLSHKTRFEMTTMQSHSDKHSAHSTFICYALVRFGRVTNFFHQSAMRYFVPSSNPMNYL